jgi:superfamily II RNA helicase
MSPPPILTHLPPAPDPDALLDGFVDYVTDQGLELYEAQEEAILELLAGSNVILNTPTGSGKSLVAAAAHFAGLAAGRRSFYTAPIKALVSEKFFALCREFGSDRVGMITGDAAVNPTAPIICCTAEILANRALRDGTDTDVDLVVMDEFHFYGDPQRGWAWQVPLLELPHAQFLLMSATLGDTRSFEADLARRTGRPTVLVRSDQRPVPLDFAYRTTTLHESITELLADDRAPVYVVHFTQREATEAAQSYLSMDPLTRDEKDEVKRLVGGFRFDSPVGKDLRRYVLGGVGVHHAGLLPKYRLLVEKLAQAGLLKIICGTDTLGVGVNVPIRSVLFTQLCKYDGSTTRVLSVREFKQIAGRAGRRGFDDRGYVWAQAPAHWVENRRAEEKAEADPSGKKRKKLVKRKPPERGYVHWAEDTFWKLVKGEPEALTSSFRVNHQLVMSLLDRPGDGCAQLRRLLVDNHEPRRRQRQHIRRSVAVFRSLAEADLLEFLPARDDAGRFVRVKLDLQDEFALHQPLSLWAIEAVEQLEPDRPDHALRVVSVIESILETPAVVIAAQLDRAKRELLAELKARGVEYDERMALLAEVEPPRPDKEWLYESFDAFRDRHPWVGSDNVRPKSIVRELYENGMTFSQYVNHYGLKRSEGVVLRYLSDCWRALGQNIPDDDKTEEVTDIVEWLGVLIRQVDSSLIDEWERLQDPTEAEHPEARPETEEPPDVTRNVRAFRVLVRNATFRWVQLLARRRYRELADELGAGALAVRAGPRPGPATSWPRP